MALQLEKEEHGSAGVAEPVCALSLFDEEEEVLSPSTPDQRTVRTNHPLKTCWRQEEAPCSRRLST